jgi:transcriptional regulator with XRE-family HTH domain
MKKDDEVLQRLGKRIKLIRTRKGMSQKTLANRVCISRSYISQIEQGNKNCSCTVLFRILEILDIRIVLFDGISNDQIGKIMTNVNEIIRILKK